MLEAIKERVKYLELNYDLSALMTEEDFKKLRNVIDYASLKWLIDRVEELENENLELSVAHNNARKEISVLESERDLAVKRGMSLSVENVRYRQALGFYADEKHWERNVFGEAYVVEKGEVARQALK